jgi:hypothetical protein
MMKGTPRRFVGSVVFVLEQPVSDETAMAVRAGVGQMDGISYCDVDRSAGTVVVTARSAVDRTDLVVALDRLGCRVRP